MCFAGIEEEMEVLLLKQRPPAAQARPRAPAREAQRPVEPEPVTRPITILPPRPAVAVR